MPSTSLILSVYNPLKKKAQIALVKDPVRTAQ
jgi:hypothetical protein